MDDKMNELDFHMCMNCRAQFFGIENFATHIKECHPPTVSYPQAYWNIPRLRPLRTPSPHNTLSSPSPTPSSSDEDTDNTFIESEFKRFEEMYGADDCDSNDPLSETDAPNNDMLDVEREGEWKGDRTGGVERKGKESGQSSTPTVIKGRVSCSGDSSVHPSERLSGLPPNDIAIPLGKGALSYSGEHNDAQEKGDHANVEVPIEDPKKIATKERAGLGGEDLCRAANVDIRRNNEATPTKELHEILSREANVSAPTWRMNNSQVLPVDGGTTTHVGELSNVMATSRDVTDSSCAMQWARSKSQQSPVAKRLVIVMYKKKLMNGSEETRQVTLEMKTSNVERADRKDQCAGFSIGKAAHVPLSQRGSPAHVRPKMELPTSDGTQSFCVTSLDNSGMDKIIGEKEGKETPRHTVVERKGVRVNLTQTGHNFRSSIVKGRRITSGDVSKERDKSPFESMFDRGNCKRKTSTQDIPKVARDVVTDKKRGLKSKGNKRTRFTYDFSEQGHCWIFKRKRNEGFEDGGTEKRFSLINKTAEGRSRRKLGRTKSRDRRFVAEGGDDESQVWTDFSRDYLFNDCEDAVTMVHVALREELLLGDVLEAFPGKGRRRTCTQMAHSHRNEELEVSSSSTYVVTDRRMSGDVSKEKAESSTFFIEDVSGVPNERTFAEMEGVICNDLTGRQMDESTSKCYRSSGTLLGKKSECEDSDYRQMSSYTSRETKGIKVSFTDDVSCMEGQGRTAQWKNSIRSKATGRQMEDIAPSVGGVLCGRKRGKVSSLKGKRRKNCAFNESGQMLTNDANNQFRFPNIWEGMKADIRGRPSNQKETGSNCLFNESKLPSAKHTDPSESLISTPNTLDNFHHIINNMCSLAGEQTKSRVSDNVQSIAEVQCIEDVKGSPKGIIESPVAISKPPNFKEDRNGCMIPLDSIQPTETRIDSTQGELPAATDCSDNRSAQMKGMLMAALSLRSVALEMDKEALTTKVRRLRSSQHTSWSREGAGEFSSMPSDNASNVSNTPLLEELRHLIEWLRSSEHVSSCRESQIEGCAQFNSDPSCVGASGCKGNVKLLARKYQSISSCRKYLTSPVRDKKVIHVGTASPKGEHNNEHRIIQEVSSLVENRNSASKDDTCSDGMAASEGRISCTMMPSKQISSCMERFSENPSASNDNMFGAGATSGRKLACTTLLSEHPSSCAENLSESLSALIGNTFHAQATSEDKITYPMMPSDQLSSYVESLIGSPYASIDNTFDAGTTSENKIICHTMPFDQVSSCEESLSKDPSASNNNTSGAGSTSSQDNLIYTTNASYHPSSHVEKLPQMSPAADYHTCDVVNTDRSDHITSLVGVSSQHTQSCGENLSENSFTSYTSMQKSPIHVNSETQCNPSSKRHHKLNLKRKSRMSSDQRAAKAKVCSIVPLSVNLGYRCDSIKFLRQHHASPFLPKNACTEHEDKTVSYHSEDEGITSETEPPTTSVLIKEPKNTNPNKCNLGIIASSVPIEEPENKDPRTYSLDIMDKVNLLSLALGKSFSFSIKPKSLLIGTNDSKKASSSMIRHDYLTPKGRHVCRCFCTSLNPSPSHGGSSTTMQGH